VVDKRTAASGKYLTGLNSVCHKFYSAGIKNIGRVCDCFANAIKINRFNKCLKVKTVVISDLVHIDR